MGHLTVLSGGQTGVDLAALYAAEQSGISYAGWVPLHYTNETGEYGIPERFRRALSETRSKESAERTEKNIKDADGILSLVMEQSSNCSGLEDPSEALKRSPGTSHGIDYAKKLGKVEEQLCFVNLAEEDDVLASERDRVVHWLTERNVTKCAIGGPRESEAEGIESRAFEFLRKVFEHYKHES